jgi:hypothetical protein
MYNEENINNEDINFRMYGQIYNYVTRFLPLVKMPDVVDLLKNNIDGMEKIFRSDRSIF